MIKLFVLVLGKSPCMYSGSFDPNGYQCPVAPMPVLQLPIECSSFIYDGLVCDENYEFNPSDNDLSKQGRNYLRKQIDT